MSYFTVSYDLIKRKDYPKLWEEFERLQGQKCLRSMYLVDVDCTAQELRDHLKSYIDDDDQMIVIEFSKKPAVKRALVGTNAWIDARF
ncbi:hypothetical protein AB8A31_10765 [Tardiphaga sp. 804_B3_N1_9]|uniref:hypothetical protein n=1 Tax=Tardiphaga sp. 804_B3_N1_9 TaxID=3240786 RepID=UPI003F2552F2